MNTVNKLESRKFIALKGITDFGNLSYTEGFNAALHLAISAYHSIESEYAREAVKVGIEIVIKNELKEDPTDYEYLFADQRVKQEE